MKKQLFAIAFLFSLVMNCTAQVGIGTNTPDASAQLELSSATKGFLPTRVALTSANVAAPVTSPASGLLIYNTATAGTVPNNVVPGYYYWNGTGWIKLATGSGAMPAGSSPGQIQYWDGAQWILLTAGNYGSQLVMCNGVPSWGGCVPLLFATTTAVSTITATTAASGGRLISDGGLDAEVGVCWNTSQSPTILNNKTNQYDSGTFVSYLTGLTAFTTYYVRAYATNSKGTVYGSQVSFTTNGNNSPSITSFSPASAGEGESVTITGLNLADVTAVKFGGVDASYYYVLNPNQVVASVGHGSSGTVSVVTPTGTATKTGFIYTGP